MKILFKGKTKEEYETKQKKKFSRFPKRCERCGTIFKVNPKDITIRYGVFTHLVCECPLCKFEKDECVEGWRNE